MSKHFNSGALALLTAALAACTHDEPKPLVRETVTAPTGIVQSAPVAATRTVAGTVRSTNVSPLAAKVMGNVLRVHVAEGDRVRAGQLLVEIDPREARAQTSAASSAIAAAEANAALAQATFKRFDALRGRGSVSPQEFDDVKARRDAASAELDRVRAMSTQARTYLDDASVRAPMDGIVTARFVDPGAQAAPGMPLLTIEDARAHRVEAFVPEELRVKTGDTVRLQWDDAAEPVEAKVTRVQPSVDAATRSSLVQIDVPAGANLRSGTYVRVSFLEGQREAIRVPAAAIVRNGALTSVFVVGTDGVARMRLITVGENNEVLSGLAPGERIVTDAANVRDGVKVS